MDDYIVYVQTDAQGRITAINSSAFVVDTTGWIEIDRGNGYDFHHAYGHYLSKALMTEECVWRYKLVDGVPVERTQAEIEADIAALPPAPPTQEERIAALEAVIAAQAEALEALGVTV